MGMGWHVIVTEPRAEYLAAAELAKDDFEVFFPLVKSQRNRLGQTNEPLFPGYLFMRLDLESGEWPSFRPAHHVLGWVRFGGIIPLVPDDTIIELERRLELINDGEGLWRHFKVGELVRVISGNIDQLAKVVTEAKSPQARASVLMGFMGRQVPVQVPWCDLRSVESQPDDRPGLPRRTRGRNRWIQGFGPAATAQA